jgi:hypothetical protein
VHGGDEPKDAPDRPEAAQSLAPYAVWPLAAIRASLQMAK